MVITCPTCGHARSISEEKIPHSATMATCPKCKTRFRFRDLPDPVPLFEPEPEPRMPELRPRRSAYHAKQAAGPVAMPAEVSTTSPETSNYTPPEHREDILATYEAQAAAMEREQQREAESPALPEPPMPQQEPEAPAPASIETREEPELQAREESTVEPNIEDLLKANTFDLPQPTPFDPEEFGPDLSKKPRHPLAGTADKHEHAGRQENPGKRKAKGDIWQTLEAWEERHKSQPADEPTGPEQEVPWEEPEKFGLFGGFVRTIKEVVVNPVSFFSRMPLNRGWSKPLVFFLIIVEFLAVVQFLMYVSGVTAAIMGKDAMADLSMGMKGFGSLMTLLFYPLMWTMLLLLTVVLNHAMLVLVRAASGGFQGTIRAVAYASSPLILSIIPLVGFPVGFFWSLLLAFLAFKYVHRTTYWQAAVAFIPPSVMMLVVLWFLAQSGPLA